MRLAQLLDVNANNLFAGEHWSHFGRRQEIKPPFRMCGGGLWVSRDSTPRLDAGLSGFGELVVDDLHRATVLVASFDANEEITAVTDASSHEGAQLLARLTVLELVVGMMLREDMLKSGKGPADILAFGENVKRFLNNRTPTGASNKQLSEAADKFFSAIASDVGSQDSQ